MYTTEVHDPISTNSKPSHSLVHRRAYAPSIVPERCRARVLSEGIPVTALKSNPSLRAGPIMIIGFIIMIIIIMIIITIIIIISIIISIMIIITIIIIIIINTIVSSERPLKRERFGLDGQQGPT